jgi:uroporphyrinogen decarboxylase
MSMSARSSASRFGVQRQPNFENLRRTILRQGPPGPVPFAELFADPGMVEAVLGEKFPPGLHRYIDEPLVDVSADELREQAKAVEMYVRFCYEMGYDYVFMITGLSFRRHQIALADTAAQPNWAAGVRYWQDETAGPIQSWKDFEAYPWPRPEEINYAALEYVNLILPEGMKVCVFLGAVFEYAMYLMGLQSFSYALRDRPDLVEAICQRVGEIVTANAAQVVSMENVGMLFLADDLGFYSGTLVSPDVIRRYVLPHHKTIGEAAHRADKPLLFHSCGNVYKLMDDFIDYVGIDAKHSFEDKIVPVEEAYQRWGDRVAILGGVDMDVLGRGTEEQVRARTREILEVCGVKGTGYCLGTGNTAANYIPKQNYLAMLDEGRRWNQEHFGAA